MRDNDSAMGQGLEIPRDILRAMQAITREVGDPMDGFDEMTTTNVYAVCYPLLGRQQSGG